MHCPDEMHFAHSTNDPSRANWQLLVDHLDAVSELASQFGRRLGIERAARLAGLLHDLGKYSPLFQMRLLGAREPVDHSTAGAALVMKLARGDDRMIGLTCAWYPDNTGKHRSNHVGKKH